MRGFADFWQPLEYHRGSRGGCHFQNYQCWTDRWCLCCQDVVIYCIGTERQHIHRKFQFSPCSCMPDWSTCNFRLWRLRFGKFLELTWTWWRLHRHWVFRVPWPGVFGWQQEHKMQTWYLFQSRGWTCTKCRFPSIFMWTISRGSICLDPQNVGNDCAPAFSKPTRIHCKTGSMSARFVFETRAKCQDFVVWYKDDIITHEVDSPFCNAKTIIAVRQSKSLEDREIGKRFAPFVEILAAKLTVLFPEGDDTATFIVPALDVRSKSSALRIAGTAWENLRQLETDRCLLSSLLICVFSWYYWWSVATGHLSSQPAGSERCGQCVMAAPSLHRSLAVWRVEALCSAVSFFRWALQFCVLFGSVPDFTGRSTLL